MPTFFKMKNHNAQQHPMLKEDEKTGLPVKLTKKQKTSTQRNSPTKRKAKPKGKRTWGCPAQKLQTTRGMSLWTVETTEKATTNIGQEKTESSHSDGNRSTTSSEDVAPQPKIQNQKRTSPTGLAPQRKTARNRQPALSNAFSNAFPINTVSEKNNENNEEQKAFRFEIDSPPDKPKTGYPSLKSLIQEMGFTGKTPQYQACVKFFEAISPKHSGKQDLVDLSSPSKTKI